MKTQGRIGSWALAAVILAMSGCHATYLEDWFGPASKASGRSGQTEFVPVGWGEWRDASGAMHRKRVYVARPRGTKGPAGLAGPVCAMTKPKPEPRVIVQPDEPEANFDANSGSYHRKITLPALPWDSTAAKALSGVKAFEATKIPKTPSYNGPAGRVGEGGAGSFTGGEMTEWKDAVRSGPVILMVIGGLLLAAGIIVAIWVKRFTLGIAVGGAGMALIATAVLFEMYPWVVLIALAGVLGLTAWWVIDAKGLLKTKVALQAVVAGVQKAENGAAEAVKASVAQVAKDKGVETVVRAVVAKAKKE